MNKRYLSVAMALLLGGVAWGAAPKRVADLTPAERAKLSRIAEVRPSPRQLAWQQLEMTAFVCFGVNTYTDREWGTGKEDPRCFNPTRLDCRQWARAAPKG